MAGPGGLVLLAIFFGSLKLLRVLFEAKLQHNIKGHTRATITSVGEFGSELTTMGLFGVYGMAVAQSGNVGAFKASGVGALVIAIICIPLAWAGFRKVAGRNNPL